ncbi:MAG: hypothetical protein WED07_05205 [Candidatus Freyarchaeum deiterrae]
MVGKQPLNVALVSLIILIQGIVMLFFGIYTLLFWAQLGNYLSITVLLLPISIDPASSILVSGSSYMLNIWININFFRFVFLITWGVFSIVVFYTFSNLKRWAYYLAIVLSVLGFFVSALILSDLMALPLVAVNILILIYLLVSEEIKSAFIIR